MTVVNPAVVTIPGQVVPTSIPKSTQLNYRQMCGTVIQWNPDLPLPLARQFVNNAYRKVVDRRLWYGMMRRGQITVPQVVTGGTASFTLGSATVQGVNTAWTVDLAGRQIRSGFSTGYYNIKTVDAANQRLTLDLPWGSPTLTGGYMICQTWVTLGYNIKMILECVNQRQGWRMYTGGVWTQSALNQYDAWRTTTGFSFAIVSKEPTADGQPQYEIYPSPTFQQVFPFLAYIQPPDMVNDGDFPVAFVRSDILVSGALVDALLFRGKNSKYYDPVVSEQKSKEFNYEISAMERMDDNLYPKDWQSDFSKMPYSQHGALWMQTHAGGFGEY